jgi:DNA polymerase IIIc chi subunit
MTESMKRNILEEEFTSRLIFALWHYSNLQIIDAHINKHEKSDYHEGVRIRDKEDSELIFMIDDLISKTEAIRKLDTKKLTPKSEL